jgi:DNA-dependent RNA polymerase auxiliary subunit epsilon
MAESKQKKKLLLKKKLADDIESSKLISEFNNRNARQTMKKITNITKTKLIHQPSSSNNNTQSSFQKKDNQPKEEDTLSLQIEEPMLAEVAGPQLKLNKYHLSFVEKTGNVAKDSIIVTNNGTTAIYYKWKRIDVYPFFKTSILDQEERFFCHAVSLLNSN